MAFLSVYGPSVCWSVALLPAYLSIVLLCVCLITYGFSLCLSSFLLPFCLSIYGASTYLFLALPSVYLYDLFVYGLSLCLYDLFVYDFLSVYDPFVCL